MKRKPVKSVEVTFRPHRNEYWSLKPRLDKSYDFVAIKWAWFYVSLTWDPVSGGKPMNITGRWSVCEDLYSRCGHTRHRPIPAEEIMPGIGRDGLPLSVEGQKPNLLGRWVERFWRVKEAVADAWN